MTAVTSKKAATAASAVLRDEAASPEAKTAAASALAQREPEPEQGKPEKQRLVSVEEWNEERRKAYEKQRETDIACPGCGSRMERTSNAVVATDPPLMSVKCTSCGHEASVLA